MDKLLSVSLDFHDYLYNIFISPFRREIAAATSPFSSGQPAPSQFDAIEQLLP
jgi:hypothetical protein